MGTLFASPSHRGIQGSLHFELQCLIDVSALCTLWAVRYGLQPRFSGYIVSHVSGAQHQVRVIDGPAD